MGITHKYTIGGLRVIPKTKWKIGNSKSISRIQIDPSVTSRSDTTKKRLRDDSSRGNISEHYQGKDKAMKYYIEVVDDLYCVYRREALGDRIVSAHHTLKEAKEAIKKQKGTKQ